MQRFRLVCYAYNILYVCFWVSNVVMVATGVLT